MNLTISGIRLMLFTTFLVVTSSCDSDDSTPLMEEEIEEMSEIFFKGSTWLPTSGLVIDNGEIGNHYNLELGITDGNLVSQFGRISISTTMNSGSTFALAFFMSSFGTDQFSSGTFEFVNQWEVSQSEGNVFFSGEFIEMNNTQIVAMHPLSGGTISISGTIPDLTLELDLELLQSGSPTPLKLTGKYSGSFEFE
ncbi:MAG: hypothetical protein ABJP45_16160 [Cyclobacteriaceae bacterium]